MDSDLRRAYLNLERHRDPLPVPAEGEVLENDSYVSDAQCVRNDGQRGIDGSGRKNETCILGERFGLAISVIRTLSFERS
jgi:hypothetical protein